MKLNSSDWLVIQFALENEIKRMKEFENGLVAETAKEHSGRYEVVLKKMEGMGLLNDYSKEKES